MLPTASLAEATITVRCLVAQSLLGFPVRTSGFLFLVRFTFGNLSTNVRRIYGKPRADRIAEHHERVHCGTSFLESRHP